MQRVLFTGLTGKSGQALMTHLEEHQLDQQFDIRVAARPTSDTCRIENSFRAEICSGVLEDTQYLDVITKDVDVLFHIAGISWSLPLVQAAAKNGVKRMILVHTTGIYSKYKAASKEYLNIEQSIELLANKYHIGLTILRPTMIYGSLKDGNMVKFISMVDRFNPMPVVNHALYKLQPVHASDLGMAYYQILTKLDVTNHKNYILSGKDEMFLMDAFKMMAKALGCERKFCSVPYHLAYSGAWFIYIISLAKLDLREKVQRLCENRIFPHQEATMDFGYDPMAFKEGITEEVRQYMLSKVKS